MSAPIPEPMPLDSTAKWKALAVLLIVGIVATGVILQQTVFDKPSTRAYTAPNASFTDHAGKVVHLADYKGKVVLMNFWATWCGPCVEEVPSMDRLAAKLKVEKPDVVVLAASVDEDGWSAVDPFIRQMGVSNFDVVLDNLQGSQKFGTNKLPETWVIGRDGSILDPGPALRASAIVHGSRFVGPQDWEDPHILSWLEAL